MRKITNGDFRQFVANTRRKYPHDIHPTSEDDFVSAEDEDDLTDEEEEDVNYFHPSYKTEMIDDVETFFSRHMLKLGERMDNFNHHGSNLIIKNI